MKSTFLLACSLLLGSMTGAYAQSAVSQKIGTIDMQSALVSTKDGQKAVADLRSKYGPKDQELQKRQQEVQNKQEQFRKTQNTMSDDAKAKLAADIDALGRALQRDSDDARTDMDQEQQRMTQDLGGKMMQVITKYATDNQYNLVFDVSGQPSNILFASTAMDITRDIIALYDKTNASAPAATTSAPKPAAPAPAAKK